MDELPWFINSEIVSFMDRASMKEFRLLNQNFDHSILTSLLRIQKLKKEIPSGYASFLKNHGSLIRGLKEFGTDDLTNLKQSGLKIRETFPNLSSLEIWHFEGYDQSVDNIFEELVDELLGLKALKHVSIDVIEVSYVFPKFSPLIRKLKSLHLDESLDLNLDKIPQLVKEQVFQGLERLSYFWEPFSTDPRWYQCYNSIKELVRFDRDSTSISSIPSRDIWCERLQLNGKDGVNYDFGLRQHSHRFHELPKNKQLDNLEVFFWKEENFFDLVKEEELPSLRGCIDHVTANFMHAHHPIIADKYTLLNVPSLEIKCLGRQFNFPSQESSKVNKLSCDIEKIHFPAFFRWASRYFPNLTHLYISSPVTPDPFPVEESSFQTLTHFYSKVEQEGGFWIELVKAAPNLNFIHYDHLIQNILDFESIKPFLQLKPHESIIAGSNDFYDQTGFKKYL